MSFQRTDIERSQIQNEILDLECKYFNIIKNILKSPEFVDDLLQVEKEISDNYGKFDELWNLKNKLKVPAERVVRHHLYVQMNDLITGIFPSPLSSDFGIRTEDAIICVDIKTIDTKGNSGDLRSTAVEKNQTSFDNREFVVDVPHNLNSFYDYYRIPILTYIVKIVYTDDEARFSLCRDKRWNTMYFVCIPNGKLSELFSYNIVDNCKTYDYYTDKDDIHYTPIWIEKNEDESVIDMKCKDRGLTHYDNGKKLTYIDKSRVVWWKTSMKNKDCIAAVKGGSSIRFNNDYLKKRYDSKNNSWDGFEEWIIPDSKLQSAKK